MESDDETIPRPDPTSRTVEQLHRESMWIDKLRSADIANLKELFKEATGARDRAISLLQDFANRSPSTEEVAQKVDAQKELSIEMFRSVNNQLSSIKLESKIALDAALQAQEKSAAASNQSLTASILKTENQVNKSIEQLQREQKSAQDTTNDKIENQRKSIDGKIDDAKKSTADMINELRNRINSADLRTGAHEGHSKGIGDSVGYAVGFIGIVIALASLTMQHWAK